jgi:hypothetical protein
MQWTQKQQICTRRKLCINAVMLVVPVDIVDCILTLQWYLKHNSLSNVLLNKKKETTALNGYKVLKI